MKKELNVRSLGDISREMSILAGEICECTEEMAALQRERCAYCPHKTKNCCITDIGLIVHYEHTPMVELSFNCGEKEDDDIYYYEEKKPTGKMEKWLSLAPDNAI